MADLWGPEARERARRENAERLRLHRDEVARVEIVNGRCSHAMTPGLCVVAGCTHAEKPTGRRLCRSCGHRERIPRQALCRECYAARQVEYGQRRKAGSGA